MSLLRARLNRAVTDHRAELRGIRRPCSFPIRYVHAESVRFLQRPEFFFGLRHSAERIFCSDVAQQQQNGGLNANGAASMHQSTWVVLLLLMFGEIAVLALGGFILWLAGEFGDDTPRWTRLRSLRRRRRAQ